MAATPSDKPPNTLGDNAVAPTPKIRNAPRAPVSRRRGDLPDGLEARYLVEHDRLGRARKFHRDNRGAPALFEDQGRRLVAREAYPDVVMDMLRIARHRGWREIEVSGDPAFRKEVWIRAQAENIRVHGHRPSELDRQSAAREQNPASGRPDRTAPDRARAAAPERTALVAHALKTLAPDPAMQARLMERANQRVAQHLEAGRRFPQKTHASPQSRPTDRRRMHDR